MNKAAMHKRRSMCHNTALASAVLDSHVCAVATSGGQVGLCTLLLPPPLA